MNEDDQIIHETLANIELRNAVQKKAAAILEEHQYTDASFKAKLIEDSRKVPSAIQEMIKAAGTNSGGVSYLDHVKVTTAENPDGSIRTFVEGPRALLVEIGLSDFIPEGS